MGFASYVGLQKIGDPWPMSLATTIEASGASQKLIPTKKCGVWRGQAPMIETSVSVLIWSGRRCVCDL